MTFENDYPQKIKSLVDELRRCNIKLKNTNEELARERKVTDSFRLLNGSLNDTIKEVK